MASPTSKTASSKALRAIDALLLGLWLLLRGSGRLALALLRPLLGAFLRALGVFSRSETGRKLSRSPLAKELACLLSSPALSSFLALSSENAELALKILDSSPWARRLLFAGAGLGLLRWGIDYESRIDGPWSPYASRCVASYYDRGFAGKPTACGELYSPWAMTAAHRTLPFGSWVRVRNLESGAEAIVRINDRGPFVSGRDIDLSKAAARKIGILDDGLAQVELQILPKRQASSP